MGHGAGAFCYFDQSCEICSAKLTKFFALLHNLRIIMTIHISQFFYTFLHFFKKRKGNKWSLKN